VIRCGKPSGRAWRTSQATPEISDIQHLYYAVGRVGDAVALLHETSARCNRVLLPDDPLTRVVRQSLANIADG
jgi:hypothetical protein